MTSPIALPIALREEPVWIGGLERGQHSRVCRLPPQVEVQRHRHAGMPQLIGSHPGRGAAAIENGGQGLSPAVRGDPAEAEPLPRFGEVARDVAGVSEPPTDRRKEWLVGCDPNFGAAQPEGDGCWPWFSWGDSRALEGSSTSGEDRPQVVSVCCLTAASLASLLQTPSTRQGMEQERRTA